MSIRQAGYVPANLAERDHRRASRRRGHRRLLALLGALSLTAGAVAGALSDSGALGPAREFARAWEHGDYRAMYSLLSTQARERVPPRRFAAAYARDGATATLERVRVEAVRKRGGAAELTVAARTRAFGTVRGTVELPLADDGVGWRRHLTFPGVPPGGTLTRQTRAPRRAAIRARDGQVIARGPAGAREHPAGPLSDSIAGTLGAPGSEEARERLHERGFPPGTLVGTSGLERLVEERVAGTPGGLLFAGGRVLASTEPKRARPVRTTIDLKVQAAALTALAGRYGGVAALDARTGQVRALAGIAFSGPQPPGSTFKIVTATAALEDGLARPSTRFPVETKAVIDGVDLENANGESCGGTFVQSFAHSCNSVFAPLGVRIGARRLVETAERYGWNRAPGLAGALASTIPRATEITSPLAVGSTAIGQGRVLATALQMASVAQTVAGGGVRTLPSVIAGEQGRRVRVTSRRVAAQLEQMMIAVVAYGTGTAASLAPVKVVGKTGTAELTSTVKDDEEGQAPPVEEGVEAKPPGYDTDAWFTAYAPSRTPKIAVCVLIVHGGAGGATAAPAARSVIQAAL